LLEVAENKFDYVTAQRIHLNEAWQKIVSHMTFNEKDFRGPDVITTTNSNYIFVSIKFPEGKSKNIHAIEMQTRELPSISASTSTSTSASASTFALRS